MRRNACARASWSGMCWEPRERVTRKRKKEREERKQERTERKKQKNTKHRKDNSDREAPRSAARGCAERRRGRDWRCTTVALVAVAATEDEFDRYDLGEAGMKNGVCACASASPCELGRKTTALNCSTVESAVGVTVLVDRGGAE